MEKTIEKILEAIDEVNENNEERLSRIRQIEKERDGIGEKLEALKDSLSKGLDSGAKDSDLLKINQEIEIARMKYDRSTEKLEEAQKVTVPDEEGRAFYEKIEALRQEMKEDILAEVWEGLRLIETSFRKYADLDRKCDSAILGYNDKIAPIHIAIGRNANGLVWKEIDKLVNKPGLYKDFTDVRNSYLYKMSKEEATKRGLDTSEILEEKPVKLWV